MFLSTVKKTTIKLYFVRIFPFHLYKDELCFGNSFAKNGLSVYTTCLTAITLKNLSFKIKCNFLITLMESFGVEVFN